jgi:hypothetical protein
VVIGYGFTLVGVALLAAYSPGASRSQSVAPDVSQISSECQIKGNISPSGERIYHVPGQKYYGRTRISPGRGERWFCSEADARAEGWRKSRV